jgi:hypothetical protein
MNDPMQSDVPDTETAPVSSSSIWSNIANVIATPGDVFDEVKNSPPSTANWLTPILLSCAAAVIFVIVVFSQVTVQQQVRDAREKEIQKMVEKGKMTQLQADQAIETSEKFTGPAVLKILGSMGAVFTSFAWLFIIALIIWLLGCKVFSGTFAYMKAVEVCALAGMVGVIGAIISMLLVVATGNMGVTLGPAFLLKEFNPANKAHQAINAVNLLTLWYIVVLGLGLSKLSGASFIKSFLWLLIPYGIIKAGLIFFGIGQPGM